MIHSMIFFSSPCVMYARHCFQSVILVCVHIRPVCGTIRPFLISKSVMYARVTSVIPVFATSCNMYIHYLPIWHGLKITFFHDMCVTVTTLPIFTTSHDVHTCMSCCWPNLGPFDPPPGPRSPPHCPLISGIPI